MLRSLAITAALLLIFSAGAHAQLRWEEPVQQFQRSPADRAVEARFAFKNTGAAPVTIKSLRSSCGCTTARLEKKTYAPGEQGEVIARFVFGARKGLHRKIVTVATDDKTQEPAVLDLRVHIHEPLAIAPALVFWKIGQPGEPKAMHLVADASQPVQIKSVTSSNPRLPALLKTINPGAEYIVSVQPTDTARKESAEITVQTDFPPDAPRAYVIHARIK